MIFSKNARIFREGLLGRDLTLSRPSGSVDLDRTLTQKRAERAHLRLQHLPFCWPRGRGGHHLTLLSWLVPCLSASIHSGLPGSSFKELKRASQFPSLRIFLTLDKPMDQIDLTSVASSLSALIEYSLCRASCQAWCKIIEKGCDALLASEHLINLQQRQSQHNVKYMKAQISARYISFIIYKSN